MGYTKTIIHIDTKGNRRIIVSREPDGLRVDEFQREDEMSPWRFLRNWAQGQTREEVARLLSENW